MVYVSDVFSNAKGGVDQKLSKKVLIVGRNGVGKSKLTQAVELGVSGEVSDILGRPKVSKAVELMALAPGRIGPLIAKATLSDKRLTSYVLQGSTEKTSGEKLDLPTGIDPKLAFPLRTVLEALRGSADKMRQFFIGFTGTITPAEIMAAMGDENSREMYLEATSAMTLRNTAAERLLAARAFGKSKANDESKSAKLKRAVAVDVGIGAPPPVSDEEIQEAAERLKDLTLVYQSVIENSAKSDRIVADYESVEKRLEGDRALLALHSNGYETMKEAHIALELEAREADAALALFESPEDGIMGAVHSVLNWMIENEITVCPVSGVEMSEEAIVGAFVSVSEHTENLRQLMEVERIAENREKIAEGSLRVSQSAVDQAAKEVAVGEAKLQAIEEVGAELNGLDTDVDAARQELEAAQARHTELKAGEERWSASQKAAESAAESDIDGARWKAFVEKLDSIIEKLLDGGVKAFSSKVQKWLPAGDVFGLRLRDGEREVCQYGLVRGGVLHTALCGAEWSRVTIGLAEATRDPKHALSIIIPEDRSWDPETLSSILEAWSGVESQVLFTSCTMPNRLPKGWQLIEVG